MVNPSLLDAYVLKAVDRSIQFQTVPEGYVPGIQWSRAA
jgi:hypothetical protein